MTIFRLRKLIVTSVLAGGMAVASFSALAQPLPPGGTTGGPPIPDATVYGAPLAIRVHNDVVASDLTGQVYVVDVFTAVYANPITGFMDFAYQVRVDDGPDSIGRVTMTNFAGWLTDVAQNPLMLDGGTGPFVLGTQFALSADRSLSGGTVGFEYNVGAINILNPGETSFVMLIKTNAPTFHDGTISIIDGATTDLLTFAPVPEGSSFAMLLPGLVPLGIALRRRRNAKKA